MWLRLCAGAVLVGLFLTEASWAEKNKPLSEIVKAVEAQGYVPTEVEFEDGAWEIEATKDGKSYELKLDPKSGEMLSAKEEQDDDEDEDDEEIAENVTEIPETPLRDLDWLIGDWIDKGENTTIKTKCRRTRGGHFLTRTFSIETEGKVVLEGTQVIAWDPIFQTIRSWMFDSKEASAWEPGARTATTGTSRRRTPWQRASEPRRSTYLRMSTRTKSNGNRSIARSKVRSNPTSRK